MYRKMLLPLDGSELSEVVFPYARELAGRLGLEMVLLYVNSPEVTTTEVYQDYLDSKVNLLHEQLGDGKVTTAIVAGNPAEEIIKYATENDIDVILLATHGRSGIRRWLMGSVADKVLQSAPMPVLLIRATVPEGILYDKWPRRTILVPLDGSELAEKVLPYVEALAHQHRPEDTEIVLLRIADTEAFSYYPPSARFATESGAAHIMPGDMAYQKIARQKDIARQYLNKVKSKLADTGLKVSIEVGYGSDAAAEIIDYAHNHPFNLIVMATHARSGLSRWAYGSIAHRILMGVTSPLLLVRTHQP